MTCPNCKKSLNIIVRKGVEFESCTSCGGFWIALDEMDKILTRSLSNKLAQKGANPQQVAPASKDSYKQKDECQTQVNYKYHTCYGRPRSARWAERLSTSCLKS